MKCPKCGSYATPSGICSNLRCYLGAPDIAKPKLTVAIKCPACGQTVADFSAPHVCIDEATFNMRWVQSNRDAQRAAEQAEKAK